jgi:hypothetical protein
MWGHYGTKVMGVYSRLFNMVLGPTSNFLWWYKCFVYGRLCPIYFSRELGFSGSIYVFHVFQGRLFLQIKKVLYHHVN